MAEPPVSDNMLPAGSAPYYLVRFASPSQRQDLYTLFSWHQEIEKVHEISDPGIARAKLQWWREEVGRILNGQSTHPLTPALVSMVEKTKIDPNMMLEMVEAMDHHLTHAPYHGDEDLHRHYRATWGNLARLLAAVLNKTDPPPQVLQNCGAYYGAVDSIRRLGGEIAHAKPRLLSKDIVRLQDAKYDDPANATRDIRALCDRHADLRPDTDFGRGLFNAMIRVSDARLVEIRRSGSAILDSALDLTPLRLLWIVWRA